MNYTSYKGRRALGARYSKPPELILDEQRLAQKYALAQENAKIKESRRQSTIQQMNYNKSQKEQGKAGMLGTAGNVIGMGMQAYSAYKRGTKSTDIKKPDQTQPQEATGIYQPAQQGTFGNTTYQIPPELQTEINKNPNVSPSVSDVKSRSQQIANGAYGAGSSALGAGLSAYNAYREFKEGEYIPGAIDTAQTGIGMYNTVDAANKTITGITESANAAEKGTEAATQAAGATGGATNSLSSALPIVGAALNVGKGLYDTATAKDAAEGTQGVWKMVDGVLQYVAPYYGAGRSAAGLVNAGLGIAGVANKTLNQVQSVFDPAGFLAGEYGDPKKLLGLKDDTWICTATDRNSSMSDAEKYNMELLRDYAIKEHKGWMKSYLQNGPILIDAIAMEEVDLKSFYNRIRMILIEPVCKYIEIGNMEEAYQIYLLVTQLLFKTYLPDFCFKEVS
ncbi:MAG: hypothetical protein LLG05_12595 [Porphyromonadaceae bacterium]|nr:hypothetical protein [Porphyromonadaceae bacterium]